MSAGELIPLDVRRGPAALSCKVPALFVRNAEAVALFLEFSTANIRNKNTRCAYYKAVCRFGEWCDYGGLHDQVMPLHVAAFIESRIGDLATPSVKQYLEAPWRLFGNHSQRATGITDYLKSDGTLEDAQAIADHSWSRTTRLYDRCNDETAFDEYERGRI